MSRSGYSDDLDPLDLGRWRGQVASAIRGKRGQAMLRELADALDAMPVKRLARDFFATPDGDVCALGVLALKRGVSTEGLMDGDDHYCSQQLVGRAFGIAHQLAAEIMFENDECRTTPELRWRYMREWVASHLKSETAPAADTLGPPAADR